MEKEEIKIFKIITLGECGVGKTSIIKRYVYNSFDYKTLSTIGINSANKEMIFSENDKIILKLIDTSGQEKFKALARSYFKNADAVLFVFSMNDKETFDNIADWIMLFKENNSREKNIPKYLVGNKNDLEIKVEQSLIEAILRENNMPFISISAKDNKNIDVLFDQIGKKLYLDYLKNGKQKQNQIIIKYEQNQSKKGCCLVKPII